MEKLTPQQAWFLGNALGKAWELAIVGADSSAEARDRDRTMRTAVLKVAKVVSPDAGDYALADAYVGGVADGRADVSSMARAQWGHEAEAASA